VIKLRGYLGGHCLNIGTNQVTPIIGVIGRKWTKIGIRIAYRAFKKAIPVMFHCPIRSGETNSERHHPGGKLLRPLRPCRTCCFDFLRPHDRHPIFPVHVRFFQVSRVISHSFYSILSFLHSSPLSPGRSHHVAYFFRPVAPRD
jgi:hypothetical protein